MTFTNRIGQDIMIKLSGVDDPKVLRASDSRVAFVYRQSGGPDKLQVWEMLLSLSSTILVHHMYLLFLGMKYSLFSLVKI